VAAAELQKWLGAGLCVFVAANLLSETAVETFFYIASEFHKMQGIVEILH
jgi:hypothetical protein